MSWMILHIGLLEVYSWLEFSPMTLIGKILNISLSTQSQCNFMKQTAKCSIFHMLSDQMKMKQSVCTLGQIQSQSEQNQPRSEPTFTCVHYNALTLKCTHVLGNTAICRDRCLKLLLCPPWSKLGSQSTCLVSLHTLALSKLQCTIYMYP
jgi:hypothetical protein